MTVRRKTRASTTPQAVAEQLAIPAAKLFPTPARMDPVTGLAVGDSRTPYTNYYEELGTEVFRLTRNDASNFVMRVAEILGVSPAHWYMRSFNQTEGEGLI